MLSIRLFIRNILNEHYLTDISDLPDDLKITQDQEISAGLLNIWLSKHTSALLYFIKMNPSGNLIFKLVSNPEENPHRRLFIIDPDGNISNIYNQSIKTEEDFLGVLAEIRKMEELD